jgi:hypothetical protein
MPIFLFGCLDIWYLELISYLNVKSCLDGQSDVLHLHESMLMIYVFENDFLCNFRICLKIGVGIEIGIG